MQRRRRFGVLSLATLAGLGAVIALAVAAAAPARQSSTAGKLSVGVEVLRFSTAGRSLKATGLVTTRLTDDAGHTTTVRSTVALSAAAGPGCRVLHLFLNELTLDLLGLHAHLDKVQLDITGNSRGGVLGSLFCRLASARVASARASAARALSVQVRRHAGHVLGFTAYLTPTATTAANPTCPVLDLVVGPLNLQLLGLVVDLNRVHLSVTATRGQGALGDLFCKLADNPPGTTT